MAIIKAQATGLWSATGTWSGGVVPTIGDTVHSNTFIVTINQSINVESIRNTSGTGITGGGGYIANDGITLTLTGTYGIWNGGTGANTLLYNGSSTINIIGTLYGSSNAGTSTILKNTASGIINITGSVTVTGGGTSGVLYGAWNSSTGTINITGNIFGGDYANHWGVYNASTGNIYVTGNVLGGTGTYGINSTTAGYINVIGNITAQTFAGLYSTSATAINVLSGNYISASNGTLPFICARAVTTIQSTNYFEFRNASNNGAGTSPANRFVAPGASVDSPAVGNVRLGTVYANSTLIGTLIVPLPSNVRKSVGTDNTVGTADLTASDFWGALTSSLTTSGSIGERLKNASTVDTTGAQIASYTA